VLMTQLQQAGITKETHPWQWGVGSHKNNHKGQIQNVNGTCPPQAATAGMQRRSPFKISRPISWSYWLARPKMFHLQ
jgi:hypothetical protein